MNLLERLLGNSTVEWIPLDQLIEVITPPSKLKKESYNNTGDIPIIDQGMDFIAGYTDKNIPFVENGQYIIFGDHSEHIKYIDFSFVQGADGLKILKPKYGNAKYIYYAFQNFYEKELNYKRHWSKAKETLIPIPHPDNPEKSLAIQNKIVGILDKFTELTAELTTELTTRKKQYEYYRCQLLEFKNRKINQIIFNQPSGSANNLDNNDIEYKKISEFSRVLRGKRLTKNLLATEGKYPVFHGGIEPLGFFDNFNRKENTVMVINVGASAGSVGFCDQKFWSSDGCFCLEHSEIVDNKYLYFAVSQQESYLKSRVRVAGIPTLHNNVLENLVIPIPPLPAQKRIARILDNFETLTNSTTEGLPHEIALRQKQYGYYRDLLFSFPKPQEVA